MAHKYNADASLNGAFDNIIQHHADARVTFSTPCKSKGKGKAEEDILLQVMVQDHQTDEKRGVSKNYASAATVPEAAVCNADGTGPLDGGLASMKKKEEESLKKRKSAKYLSLTGVDRAAECSICTMNACWWSLGSGKRDMAGGIRREGHGGRDRGCVDHSVVAGT